MGNYHARFLGGLGPAMAPGYPVLGILVFWYNSERNESLIEIRFEQPKDIDEIRLLNDTAFGQPAEGRIVDKLRKSCKEIISLVAIANNKVIGHILFSPAMIEIQSNVIEGMGLAPMSVLPEWQNQGIGSKLVKEGLQIVDSRKCPFLIVLGHEKYYPRFRLLRCIKEWHSGYCRRL